MDGVVGLRQSEEILKYVHGGGHEVYGYQGLCGAGALCLYECD